MTCFRCRFYKNFRYPETSVGYKKPPHRYAQPIRIERIFAIEKCNSQENPRTSARISRRIASFIFTKFFYGNHYKKYSLNWRTITKTQKLLGLSKHTKLGLYYQLPNDWLYEWSSRICCQKASMERTGLDPKIHCRAVNWTRKMDYFLYPRKMNSCLWSKNFLGKFLAKLPWQRKNAEYPHQVWALALSRRT